MPSSTIKLFNESRHLMALYSFCRISGIAAWSGRGQKERLVAIMEIGRRDYWCRGQIEWHPIAWNRPYIPRRIYDGRLRIGSNAEAVIWLDLTKQIRTLGVVLKTSVHVLPRRKRHLIPNCRDTSCQANACHRAQGKSKGRVRHKEGSSSSGNKFDRR